MNIYFACSITGGREFELVYQSIVQALEADGHHIPTSHLASSEVMDMERVILAEEVFTRDIGWINTAHALVAEVSTPSHGVGYEIAYALSLGKPVLCLHQQGRKVSKMLTGNTFPNIRVQAYETQEQAINSARDFLSSLDTHL